jgi:hypothetical protein
MARCRSRSSLAALLAGALVLISPGRAGALDDVRAEVQASVVTEVPGFQRNTDDLPGTGFLDESDMGDVSEAGLGDKGAELLAEEFDAGRAAAYSQLFTADDGSVLSITAFDFGAFGGPVATGGDRQDFEDGFFGAFGSGGGTEIPAPVEPTLVTVRQGTVTGPGGSLPAVGALYFVDDRVVALMLLGEDAGSHLTDALTAQTAHLAPTPIVIDTSKLDLGGRSGEKHSTAYRLGQTIGTMTILGALMGGIVGAIVWVSRRKGPKVPTPGIYAPPPPPSGPAVAGAPPAPLSLAAPVAEVPADEGPTQTITTTKTLSAPADELYDAIADAGERRVWLIDDDLTELEATPPRSVRFAASTHGQVTMTVAAKPDGRSTLTIRHSGLRSEAEAQVAKAHWKANLADLHTYLGAARV